MIEEIKYSRKFWLLVDKVINEGLVGIDDINDENLQYAIETAMPDSMEKVLKLIAENIFILKERTGEEDVYIQDSLLNILMREVRKKVVEKLGVII